MKAIIPVAGYATRLYPLTKNQPKALLTINNQTILDIIIKKIINLKVVNEVVLVTNDFFYNHFKDWQKTQTHSIKISILNDGTLSNEDRLGAVADINLAIKTFNINNEDLLIMAGDNLFEDELFFIYELFTATKKSQIAVYDLKSLSEASCFGVCTMEPKSRQILSFIEKPQNPTSTLIGTMIWLITAQDARLIDKSLTDFTSSHTGEMNAGSFIAYLVKHSLVYGYNLKGKWYDIGTIEKLTEARKNSFI